MSKLQHPEAFIAPQTGVATLVLGEPGITKTRTYEAFARALNRWFFPLVPSQRDPADIIGYTRPAKMEVPGIGEVEVADYVSTKWRVIAEHAHLIWPSQYIGSLVLFDEVIDCTPAHQAACQQMLNDGIPNTLICGCGNPLDISVNGFELGASVVNRLCVLDYSAPLDEWKANMMTDFADVPHRFPILPENWKTYVPEARGKVLGFLDAQPQHAQKCPEKSADRAKPWPSLRSWTNAATLLAAAEACATSRAIQRKLVEGCVGKGCAQKFFGWIDAADLPPTIDVLADPGIFDFAKDGSRTYAVLAGCFSYLLANKDEQTYLQMCAVLTHAAESGRLAISSAIAVSVCRNRMEGVEFPKPFVRMFVPVLKEIIDQPRM